MIYQIATPQECNFHYFTSVALLAITDKDWSAASIASCIICLCFDASVVVGFGKVSLVEELSALILKELKFFC